MVEIPPSQLYPANNDTSATASSLIEELKMIVGLTKPLALFVELNLHNPASNVMTAAQFYCEFFDNGYITCSYRLRTFPMASIMLIMRLAIFWKSCLGIILSRLHKLLKESF